MNRSRRQPQIGIKPFVPGGVYDPNTQLKLQQQVTLSLPQRQQENTNIVQQQKVVKEKDNNDPVADEGMDVEDGIIDENGKPKFKKIFMTRKKSSVRAKEKKIRQNRQLRKAILPKNALMALNEVKGISISDVNVNGNNNGGGFVAVITVNNKQYEGHGASKVSAKNNACEKALRDYVIAKMHQKPRLGKSISGSTEAMETTGNGESDDEASLKDGDEVDDVPMINLASFAIFKLFSEWENEGYVIPELHPSANAAANGSENGTAEPKEPRKAPIRNELPSNWEGMHPATLLCVMRPGLNYKDYGVTGEKPNVFQKLGVTVDNQEFIGTGRSKKLARRNAAAAVCNALFGTNYAKDDSAAV